MKNDTYYITHSLKIKGKFCLYYHFTFFFGLKHFSIFKGYFDTIEDAKEHIKLLKDNVIEKNL